MANGNISFKRKATDNSIDVRKLRVIRGFPLNKDAKIAEFLENYKSIGFQASHIGKAVNIIKAIKKRKCCIISCMHFQHGFLRLKGDNRAAR